MARDLVTEGVQVHDMAGTVRDYWFALSREAPSGRDAGPIGRSADCRAPRRDAVPAIGQGEADGA